MILRLKRRPFEGVDHLIRREEPLERHTTFRIGGPARYFAEPRNAQELQHVYHAFLVEGEPIWTLGAGSNLLVSDEGVDGAVISMKRFEANRILRTGSTLLAGAGVRMRALAEQAAELGLSGLEELAGVPGTLGGAIAMNAGPAPTGIGKFIDD